MKFVTWKDILAQLKADLIGKDSYRGVTLTYTWLANQFGHFSLGFIPTLLVYPLFLNKSNPSVYAAACISLTWLCFETYNFLGPLLMKSKSKFKHIFYKGSKYQFQPAWGNIAFDTITDLCFFWNGAVSASLLLDFESPKLYLLLFIWIVLLGPMYYWYRTKIFLQTAEFPYQFRLSQFENQIDDESKRQINDYLTDPGNNKHLFLYGASRSGKTNLGVGLGTERAIRHQACKYTTAIKLFELFNDPDKGDAKDLWTWLDAGVLVIDDINPGHPVKQQLVTPQRFSEIMTRSQNSSRNQLALKDKNVVWVLGSNDYDRELIDGWQEMLINIGVKPGDIRSVHLFSQATMKISGKDVVLIRKAD